MIDLHVYYSAETASVRERAFIAFYMINNYINSIKSV